jgi:HK97 family phage portal protein
MSWFTKLFTGDKRSLENPATDLASPAEWIVDGMGGGPSASGEHVNHETIHHLSPIWKGVNLIARTVARVPMHVYKREGNGKVRAPEHPAYSLLRYQPAENLNAYIFKMILQGHAVTRGNGYAYIERDGAGKPVGLMILNPALVTPVKVRTTETGPFDLFYLYGSGNEFRFPALNVLHIRGYGDELEGWSLVRVAKTSLGLGLASEKYGARFFGNNARPDFALKTPNKLDDKAFNHLRETWGKMHQGVGNSHRAAILEQGLEVQPFSWSNEDAQFLETRQFNARDCANWLLLQPHKVGDASKASYNSLEQENASFLSETIDPWFVCWEMECRAKLFTEAEKRADSHVIEFKREALLAADLKTRGEYYRMALGGAPWMLVDEVRSAENMNELPDDQGQTYHLPLNMGAGGGLPDGQGGNGPATELKSEVIAAHRRVILDVLSRMQTRITSRLANGKADETENRRVCEDALTPAIHAARLSGCAALDAADIARQLWNLCASNDTTIEALTDAAISQNPKG